MGWGISFQVAILVLKENDFVQRHDHIVNDAWVRILIDRDRRSGVGDKDDAESILYLCFFHGLLNRTGDINEFCLC